MGQITVQLNGEPHATSSASISELIQELKLNSDHVIVEHNLAVLKAINHNHTPLNTGDVIEIIRYIGGGQKIIY
ncbi:MAG: sulfur carrier protein ThiS [Candidatus Margulisiibacteriota bacterium]